MTFVSSEIWYFMIDSGLYIERISREKIDRKCEELHISCKTMFYTFLRKVQWLLDYVPKL